MVRIQSDDDMQKLIRLMYLRKDLTFQVRKGEPLPDREVH